MTPRRPRAAPGQRAEHRPAESPAAAGPGAAAGGGPCCGRLRCRRLWTRQSRRAPWRLAPARREADGRPKCRGRPCGHREPLRRSRCYAAVVAPREARLPGHSGPTGVGSGRQLVAALGPAGRQDGPAGTGAHAQPEAVGLRAPAVVRLVGALAHVKTPSSCSVQRASLQDATLAERGGATARPYAGATGRSTTPTDGTPTSRPRPHVRCGKRFTRRAERPLPALAGVDSG
jgi:hypothetical protein